MGLGFWGVGIRVGCLVPDYRDITSVTESQMENDMECGLIYIYT